MKSESPNIASKSMLRKKQCTTVLPSRLNQSNFFDILLPLAKWNMIICLLRTFLENALKKQNFPFSPLSLHCACISVGNSVFFFFKLAAPCMFCFLRSRAPRLSRNMVLPNSNCDTDNFVVAVHEFIA